MPPHNSAGVIYAEQVRIYEGISEFQEVLEAVTAYNLGSSAWLLCIKRHHHMLLQLYVFVY